MTYVVTIIAGLLTALIGYHLFVGGNPQLWLAFGFFGAMTILSIPLGVLEREVRQQSRIYDQFKDIR